MRHGWGFDDACVGSPVSLKKVISEILPDWIPFGGSDDSEEEEVGSWGAEFGSGFGQASS